MGSTKRVQVPPASPRLNVPICIMGTIRLHQHHKAIWWIKGVNNVKGRRRAFPVLRELTPAHCVLGITMKRGSSSTGRCIIHSMTTHYSFNRNRSPTAYAPGSPPPPHPRRLPQNPFAGERSPSPCVHQTLNPKVSRQYNSQRHSASLAKASFQVWSRTGTFWHHPRAR